MNVGRRFAIGLLETVVGHPLKRAFVRVKHDAFRLCRRAVSGGHSLMAVPPEAMPDHDLDDEARDLRVKDYAEHCSIPFSI